MLFLLVSHYTCKSYKPDVTMRGLKYGSLPLLVSLENPAKHINCTMVFEDLVWPRTYQHAAIEHFR